MARDPQIDGDQDMNLVFDKTRAPKGITNIACPAVSIDWHKVDTPPNVIELNSARYPGRFIPLEGDNAVTNWEPVAIVGYGASLKDTWEELQSYHTIFTCSGAHRFLLKRGIIPRFHGESDPQPHKANMLGDLHEAVTYLPASICHPNYMRKLEDRGVRMLLWHPFLYQPEMYKQIPRGDYVIPGATVIGPRLMRLARLMGYTNLHMYGIDGSGGHTEEHPNKGLYEGARQVHYQGKPYTVHPHLLVHIGTMFDEMSQFPEDTTFEFHGESLISDLAQTWKRVPQDPNLTHPMCMVKDE